MYDYDSKKKTSLEWNKSSCFDSTHFIIITINNLHSHKVHFCPQIVLTKVADRL